LQRVVTDGTGKALLRLSEGSRSAAGKTGTSDGLRDSWFAGFTGDHLAVVWLGRDDNKSSSLTGSTGALKVWGSIMEALQSAPLKLVEPAGISWHRIDLATLQQTNRFNSNSTLLPFTSGSEPTGQDWPIINTKELEEDVQTIFKTINSWFD
jgi:penicillin-binding protein 1B